MLGDAQPPTTPAGLPDRVLVPHGLIYVIDIRNGLYILRYTGPHADEVANIGFLEGNSNLGDALRLDQSP
jgi:hypothetical protein